MASSPIEPPTAFSRAKIVLRALWHVARPVLISVVNILLALILLFEEWGWQPLSRAIAWFARFRLIARFEAWVASLSPYPALLVFGLPASLLLPVKLLGLWLLAGGHVLSAAGVIIAAKIVGTAFAARLFLLTKPALMQIGWFRRLHDWFMPWKDALFAYIRASFVWRYGRMLKSRMKQVVRRALDDWRPVITGAASRLRATVSRVWHRYFGGH